MALNDSQIKALKPTEKRYLKSDGGGLSLDVLPSGVMTWFYRYRLQWETGEGNSGQISRLVAQGRAQAT